MNTGFVKAGLQMGLESLIVKPKRGFYNVQTTLAALGLTDSSNAYKLPDIEAQAVVREIHTDDLEITDHPVQQGAAITDHAFKLPAEIVIEMGWSTSPPSGGLVNSALAAAAAASPVINTLNNLYQEASAVNNVLQSIQSGSGIGAGQNNLNAIYEQLLKLQSSRAIFDVYTGRRVYTNMLCKSLAVETDFRTENALMVKMTCKQIIIVNTQTVALPKELQKNPTDTASQSNSGVKQLITSTRTALGG